MAHQKMATERPEQPVQYADDFKCCCDLSLLGFASFMLISCATVCLITASTFAALWRSFGPGLVLPIAIIGFVCGVIFMIGGVYTCSRSHIKYQRLPRSDAKNRLFYLWALFALSIILDIALLAGSIISFISGGVINGCDSCAIITILFSVCFVFLLYCIMNSVILAIVAVKSIKYHAVTADSTNPEIEVYYF